MNLSIIIPVYNVEKYLRKCLDSCLNQDVSAEEYELICINDGSPDDCDKILEEYALNYRNLRVITQINQGLSVARNKGLSYARGRYVWFVDSDDWIEPGAVQSICNIIKTENNKGNVIDIVQIGFQNVYEDTLTVNVPSIPFWYGSVTGIEYMNMKGLPTPAQFNIYRRDLLINNNLWFKDGILHEDIEFKPRVLHFCKSCLCATDIIYNYLQRKAGSITSSFKLRNATDLLFVMNSLCKFIKDQGIKEEELQFFRKRIGITLNLLLRGSQQLSKKDKVMLEKKLGANKSIFKLLVKSNRLLYKVEGILFSISPKVAFRLLS